LENISYLWNWIGRGHVRLKRKPELPSNSFCSGLQNKLEMKEIKLSSQGKNKGKYIALVDDEDYEYLNQWRWCVFIRKTAIYVGSNINA
jgi:hypothetical protein